MLEKNRWLLLFLFIGCTKPVPPVVLDCPDTTCPACPTIPEPTPDNRLAEAKNSLETCQSDIKYYQMKIDKLNEDSEYWRKKYTDYECP